MGQSGVALRPTIAPSESSVGAAHEAITNPSHASTHGVGILRVLPQRLPIVAEIIADDKIDREVEIEGWHCDTGNIEHQYAAHAQTRRRR